MTINITDNTFKRVSELIKNNLNQILRISVEAGGCQGFIYHYTLVLRDNIAADDHIFEKGTSTIIIDPVSQELISGCIIDFIEELGKREFLINNPNIKEKCGCGKSFSIA